MVDKLRNTETVFALKFTTATSIKPSPSKSPIANACGFEPVE